MPLARVFRSAREILRGAWGILRDAFGERLAKPLAAFDGPRRDGWTHFVTSVDEACQVRTAAAIFPGPVRKISRERAPVRHGSPDSAVRCAGSVLALSRGE
jgi:hypothetical protein